MDKLIFFMRQIVEIYQQVFSVLRKNPMIYLLFIWIGVLDLIALVLLFLAPSPPVSFILAPIIRTFWSDQYLHYPDNFLLLPKLFGHAHFLISTVIGVFITGLVIKQIEGEWSGKKSSIISTVQLVLKKYISLVLAWLISYGVYVAGLRILMTLLPPVFPVQLLASFLLGVAIQSILGFFLPALILLNQGFLRGLWEAMQFGLRNILLTSSIILVPVFLALCFSVAKLYTPFFVRFHPEIVLWVLAGGIVLSVLVDLWVTSSVTLIYLKARQGKS